MRTLHDKTLVTWWHHSTEIYQSQLKSLVTWSQTHCIEKKMSKIKEAPFTDNYWKLKRVNLFKLLWKSHIEASTKITKWDSPFSVTFITCKPFPDKWSKIITTQIMLGKISSFVLQEILIMKFFIKLLKDTFLYKDKNPKQPNLLNPSLTQEFLP